MFFSFNITYYNKILYKYILMNVKNIKSFIEFYRFLNVTDCISVNPRNFKDSIITKDHPELLNNAKNVDYKEKSMNKSEFLKELKKEALKLDCDLKDIATNFVFSDGNENSKIMLLGEAPGAKEDLQGKPFVGEAGQLLDKMLSFIDLTRENFYISNMVFWRPPGNRTPSESEISLCLPITMKHISIIQPKLLILVGSIAAKTLLNTKEGITKLRGKNHYFFDKINNTKIATRAIFHPAYLLRNPIEKKRTWEDLLEIDDFISQKEFCS